MTCTLEPILGKGRRVRQPTGGGELRRSLILAVIRETPGLSFRGVARASGVPTGTLAHHLGALRGRGDVVAYTYQCSTRFFPAPTTPAIAAQLVLRRCPTMGPILACLGKERLAQKEVMARLPGVARSTVQNGLARLVANGAVSLTQSGRFKFYEVAA